MFRCVNHIANNNICTRNHSIYYDELLDEIQTQFNDHILGVINSNKYDELCETILKSVYEKAQKLKISKLQKELQVINKSIKDAYKTSLQNSGSDNFASLYSAQKSIMQKITEITNSNIKILSDDFEMLKTKIYEYLCSYKVNENSIKFLISKIEIGHLERRPYSSYKKVTLYYRF